MRKAIEQRTAKEQEASKDVHFKKGESLGNALIVRSTPLRRIRPKAGLINEHWQCCPENGGRALVVLRHVLTE